MRGRRHRHPHVLADLHVHDQPGHVDGSEQQRAPEWHLLVAQFEQSGDAGTGREVASLVELAIGRQVGLGDDAEHPTPMHHHRAVVEPPLEGQGSTHDDDRQEVRGRRPHPFHRGERGVEHGVLEQQVVDRVAGQAQLREDRQRDPLGRALASDAHDRVGVGERIGDRDRHRAGRDAGEPLVVGGVEVHGRSLAHRSTDREGRGAPPQGDDSRGPGVPPAQPSEGAQPSVRRVLPSFSK